MSGYDDATLFHVAAEAERAGNHAQAHALYARLVVTMPTSDLVDAARFNDGLAYEHEHAWAKAAEIYAPIIARPLPADPETRRTWLDAHFRRAACLAKSGDWAEVASVFTAVLAIADLELTDRVEALVGRGIAAKELGDAADAELMFGQVLHLVRVNERASELRDFGAEAAFQSAEVAYARFVAVRLAFPNDLLAKRLDEKCQALLAAQTRYIRAVQFGDAHTVAAAGRRIGGMYEVLYSEIVGLEVPPDFTDEERDVYRHEVRSRVRVLAEKAIKIYERSVLIGKRASTAAGWVEESEAALERLRAIYLEDDALSSLP